MPLISVCRGELAPGRSCDPPDPCSLDFACTAPDLPPRGTPPPPPPLPAPMEELICADGGDDCSYYNDNPTINICGIYVYALLDSLPCTVSIFSRMKVQHELLVALASTNGLQNVETLLPVQSSFALLKRLVPLQSTSVRPDFDQSNLHCIDMVTHALEPYTSVKQCMHCKNCCIRNSADRCLRKRCHKGDDVYTRVCRCKPCDGCNLAGQQCVEVPKEVGTPCNDNNECTVNDSCQLLTESSSGELRVTDTGDNIGVCEGEFAGENVTCNDNDDLCTVNDKCVSYVALRNC